MTYSDDLTVLMTADNAPVPNVTSASSVESTWDAFKAFDHNETADNKWLANAATGWIKFDFGSALYAMSKYTILIPDEAAEVTRAPSNWTLDGSNNDSDWTTLDTQTSQSFTNHERKTYTFTNSTKYRYYRINVTANNGGALMGMQEIQMMRQIVSEANNYYLDV